MKLLAVKWN